MYSKDQAVVEITEYLCKGLKMEKDPLVSPEIVWRVYMLLRTPTKEYRGIWPNFNRGGRGGIIPLVFCKETTDTSWKHMTEEINKADARWIRRYTSRLTPEKLARDMVEAQALKVLTVPPTTLLHELLCYHMHLQPRATPLERCKEVMTMLKDLKIRQFLRYRRVDVRPPLPSELNHTGKWEDVLAVAMEMEDYLRKIFMNDTYLTYLLQQKK